jgi:pilus assembly protein CpaC
MGEGEVPKVPTDYVDEPNDIEFFILGRTEGKTGIPHRSTIQHHTPFTLQKHFASENQWVVGPHGHSSD